MIRLSTVCAAISAFLLRVWGRLKSTSAKFPRLQVNSKSPQGIILHCAATPYDMDIGVEEIDKWHKARGWRGCGYHRVVRINGHAESGRSIDPFETGAHCLGKNDHIGICWVGGKTADDVIRNAQFRTIISLCVLYMREFRFTLDDVHFHNEFADKECPRLDKKAFMTHLYKAYHSGA